MSAAASILALMTGPLVSAFGGQTWATWRAVLKAAFALSLTDDERAVVETLTQRQILPASPVRELWLLLGRRSGKSIVAALLAVWATCCRTYTLAPGEVGVFMVIAADRKQARVIKRYVSGLLRAHPALEALIDHETADAIWLTNGLCIEIHTCSFRSLRGYTCIGAACDEVAFWDDEDSANPDHEVLVALRAAMASVPEAMLIGLTSVYARRAEVWRMYEKHFGRNESTGVLVVNGSTRAMNPTIDQRVIDAAYEDDPIAAAAEFGAEFRRDVERFVSLDAVEAVTMPGRSEQPYQSQHQYVAFLDAAGGTGKDSMTLAIAHGEHRGGRDLAVLDVIREVAPPFSPEAVVKDFASTLRRYRVARVTSDRYAGSWPVEAFSKTGITVESSARVKSDIYRDVLPMITSQRVELLDVPRLKKQLLSLERRTTRGGREQIAEPPSQHDDVINAAAGALVEVLVEGAELPFMLANSPEFHAWSVAHGVASETDDDVIEADVALDGEEDADDAVSPDASVAGGPGLVDQVVEAASGFASGLFARGHEGWSVLSRRTQAAQQAVQKALAVPGQKLDRVLPATEEQARANALDRKRTRDRKQQAADEAEALADEIAQKAAISKEIDKRMKRGGGAYFPQDDLW